jgi:hypothetical protein
MRKLCTFNVDISEHYRASINKFTVYIMKSLSSRMRAHTRACTSSDVHRISINPGARTENRVPQMRNVHLLLTEGQLGGWEGNSDMFIILQ